MEAELSHEATFSAEPQSLEKTGSSQATEREYDPQR